MKKASYAPVYAVIYPELAELFKACGYALAVHGSMQRDFDLIAIPWIDSICPPDEVVEKICSHWAVFAVGEPEQKKHGRVCYTLSFCGECFLDLSFMPVEQGKD